MQLRGHVIWRPFWTGGGACLQYSRRHFRCIEGGDYSFKPGRAIDPLIEPLRPSALPLIAKPAELRASQLLHARFEHEIQHNSCRSPAGY